MKTLSRTAVVSVALLVGTIAGLGCHSHSAVGSSAEPAAALTATEFREWQFLGTDAGTQIDFEEVMNELAQVDVIYLGEEHHNRHHIQSAIKVLDGLLQRGRAPVLTIEMFGWDGQTGLDHYISDPEMKREQFLEEARWKKNWPGGDFKDYEPLVQFAREHHIPVLAMNPPLSLVRKVVKRGLTEALTDDEMARWKMQNETIVDDPAYREVIVEQLRNCHGGMSDDMYERVYEASMFRDEGMARTISTRLASASPDEGPIVSYTGGGHVQHRLPVPKRVSRRRGGGVKQATIYMASLEPEHPEYVEELLQKHVADYLWLTPLSEHGPPRRCG